MNTETILIGIISILGSIVGYFIKKTYDKTELISADISDMKPKLDILWKDKIAPAQSPRQLNSSGENILNTSGVKKIIDQKRDYLLGLVKAKNTLNAYDAEDAIISVMAELPDHCPETVSELKQGAFQSGVDVNTVLFAGSIYLRNLIFKELGFSLEDLDVVR